MCEDGTQCWPGYAMLRAAGSLLIQAVPGAAANYSGGNYVCSNDCTISDWTVTCPPEQGGGGGGGGVEGCSDDGYDPNIGSSDTFNKQGFADYLRANVAADSSTGQCAKHVRRALCSGGGIQAACNGGPPAGQYGTFLGKLGFAAVGSGSGSSYNSGYSPQVGDIAVFSYGTNGHVCGWDGSNWVSDFVQASPNPSPNSHPEYTFVLYRKP